MAVTRSQKNSNPKASKKTSNSKGKSSSSSSKPVSKAVLFPEGPGFILVKILQPDKNALVCLVRSLDDGQLYVRKETGPEKLEGPTDVVSKEVQAARALQHLDVIPKLIGWTNDEDKRQDQQYLPESWIWYFLQSMLSTNLKFWDAGVCHGDGHGFNFFLHDHGFGFQMMLGGFGRVLYQKSTPMQRWIEYCTLDLHEMQALILRMATMMDDISMDMLEELEGSNKYSDDLASVLQLIGEVNFSALLQEGDFDYDKAQIKTILGAVDRHPREVHGLRYGGRDFEDLLLQQGPPIKWLVAHLSADDTIAKITKPEEWWNLGYEDMTAPHIQPEWFNRQAAMCDKFTFEGIGRFSHLAQNDPSRRSAISVDAAGTTNLFYPSAAPASGYSNANSPSAVDQEDVDMEDA
ncbi:hypothetical protein LTR66_016968 [Elasticomyces elasticus]|nr:hypothetical protein LTR66_016968 [Elasticomyces elasticus]